MDKIVRAVLVSLFAGLFAPTAVNAENSPPIISDGYFGIGLGGTKVNVASGATDDQADETDKYFKIFGGVEINPEIYPHLNIEFGYIDFGEYSAHFSAFDETDTARASAITAAIVGDGDIGENSSVFFRLGLLFWKAEYEVEANFSGPVSGSGDGTGNSNFGGVGLDHRLNPNITIRFEFEKYKDIADDVTFRVGNLGTLETAGSDINLLGLSIIYMLE